MTMPISTSIPSVLSFALAEFGLRQGCGPDSASASASGLGVGCACGCGSAAVIDSASFSASLSGSGILGVVAVVEQRLIWRDSSMVPDSTLPKLSPMPDEARSTCTSRSSASIRDLISHSRRFISSTVRRRCASASRATVSDTSSSDTRPRNKSLITSSSLTRVFNPAVCVRIRVYVSGDGARWNCPDVIPHPDPCADGWT